VAQAWRMPASGAGDPLVRAARVKVLRSGLERSHDAGVQGQAVRRRLRLRARPCSPGRPPPRRPARAGCLRQAAAMKLVWRAKLAAPPNAAGSDELQVDRGAPAGRPIGPPVARQPWLRVSIASARLYPCGRDRARRSGATCRAARPTERSGRRPARRWRSSPTCRQSVLAFAAQPSGHAVRGDRRAHVDQKSDRPRSFPSAIGWGVTSARRLPNGATLLSEGSEQVDRIMPPRAVARSRYVQGSRCGGSRGLSPRDAVRRHAASASSIASTTGHRPGRRRPSQHVAPS
jgi:hypothetical protein